MILGTLKNSQSLDGDLIVVHPDRQTAVRAQHLVPSLREALEKWSAVEGPLQALDQKLRTGSAPDTFQIVESDLHSALPRTWLFADGSAYIHHIKLVRQARNAPLPETLLTVPLMYQAECGQFLAPLQDIPQRALTDGTDFEAEVGVLLDHVPMGTSAEAALKKIRLFVLINDVSLRGLIPGELAAGFGFFVSKPAKALSPFAVTPDELAGAYQEGRVHLPLSVDLNGQKFGRALAGEMHFHFGQLIAHAAQTRDLVAGTLIGSGTVANEDATRGSSCLAEKRTIEQIQTGQPVTPFLKVGDEVKIWMEGPKGLSIFGQIRQRVARVQGLN